MHSTAAGRQRQVMLAPVPESVRTARKLTVAALRAWHLDSLIDDAVVIASELVTNAIRHGTPEAAGGYVELTWSCQVSRLICVIIDRGTEPPQMSSADEMTESGHGLQIVGALAAAWGWTMLGTGEKAVWAALRLPLASVTEIASPFIAALMPAGQQPPAGPAPAGPPFSAVQPPRSRPFVPAAAMQAGQRFAAAPTLADQSFADQSFAAAPTPADVPGRQAAARAADLGHRGPFPAVR